MFSRFSMRLALSVSAMALAAMARAQFVYSTGFEVPDFSATETVTITIPPSLGGGSFTSVPGSPYTNPDWTFTFATTPVVNPTTIKNAADSVYVQTGVVRSGSQALLVDGAVANQNAFGGTYIHSAPRGGVLDISFDMRVENPSAQAGQWGFSLIDVNRNSFGAVGFYSGLLAAGSDTIIGLPPGPTTFVGYNTWATYGVRFDLNVNTMSVSLNGAQITSMQNIPLRTDVSLGSIQAFSFGGSTPLGVGYGTTPERAYFDNVRIQIAAAPEPGTLGFFIVAGSLVAIRRRKK